MTDGTFCESCGMPLRSEKDYGGGDTTNKYCVHCTDEKGILKPYDQVLEGMVVFAVKMMGSSEEEARKAAVENMAKMPAWKDRGE